MASKLPLSWPYAAAFRVLRPLRRLRGTRADLFGLDPDRRTERALIAEYEQLITASADLPYETRVELANSPLSIRGYGPIKERAVATWRESLSHTALLGRKS
jgi:indolepyruvate ferredoxin oxidoreductase